MAQMARLRCTWTGPGIIGPGLTTFYFTTAGVGAPAAAKALLASQAMAYPPGTVITIPQTGDLIEATTGELAGTWSESSGGGTVTGSGTGTYAMGVGMQIRWFTSGIVNRRRVTGSTFIVPVMGNVFASDGTVNDATVASLLSAANTFVGSTAKPVIWSRPKAGRVGSYSAILSASVPDRPSWLRSRRT